MEATESSEVVQRNPVDGISTLEAATAEPSASHPQALPQEEDSAVTKAEKTERHGVNGLAEPAPKRQKPNPSDQNGNERLQEHPRGAEPATERRKGVVPIKAEFLVTAFQATGGADVMDDDAAEEKRHTDSRDRPRKEKSKGQNTSRDFGSSRDEKGLCQSRANSAEFSSQDCKFGDSCKFEHDLRKYLKDWKRSDLSTFGGICPIYDVKGKCDSGWKCRFVSSHMVEVELQDGRKELRLLERDDLNNRAQDEGGDGVGVLNVVSTQAKVNLMKRKYKTPQADEYVKWLDAESKAAEKVYGQKKLEQDGENPDKETNTQAKQDNRACYTEPPFLPSEKRRVYFGPETPILAPLTTQGNLPFRRLCVGLGAQLTYSEMAMSLPLIQGQKSEWALLKTHASELQPPIYNHDSASQPVILSYDHGKDLRFGVQISANKPSPAIKATEVITALCPYVRVLDLNCGCPIDLVYRTGAGSGLLDNPGKLEKMVRGMNTVSGEIPITVKIRMGTKDNKPTALRLVDRLTSGGLESQDSGLGPPGVAAITLHGRSRQQRYAKSADWSYIAECASLIQRYNTNHNDAADTIQEPDPRHQAPGEKFYFIGNGDCYSHIDYNDHLSSAKVDAVMVARGALIKPWVFEEIAQGQYIDKSATERLGLVEQFVRNGLETWGSDEMGVGTTRRFLLEWLSFAYRYVPVGIIEHLPPNLQDRPPAWRGRNELETLLGSDNFKDWIKISEMFLGPAHKDFKFAPKHKSNSYEIDAEG